MTLTISWSLVDDSELVLMSFCPASCRKFLSASDSILNVTLSLFLFVVEVVCTFSRLVDNNLLRFLSI